MRLWAWVAVACSKGDAETSEVPYGTGGCGFSEPDDLPDVENEIFGQEHACEDALYYDDYSEFDWLTVWYVGDFHIDDCGVLSGEERWKVYPTPRVQDKGMTDCTVVYTVTGTRTEPGARGDFGLSFTAEVDEEATDCVVLDGRPLYAGYETMTIDYDVELADGGAASFFFGPSELNDFQGGSLLGTGFGNGNHLNYVTDSVCTSYTSF
jgi:hypothetical protein